MQFLPEVISWDQVLLRLSATLVCAAVIGWEREQRRRPAGLRTHILVALGAATFAIVGVEATATTFANVDKVSLDPFRVLYAVIGGIGFLGAGAVIRAGADVRGLTTAASIWMVAALGLAAGLGMYFLAAVATIFALVTLRVFSRIEVRTKDPQDRP